MSRPRIVSIADGSPAQRCGLLPGDEIASIDGESPRDVIAFRLLVDEPDPVLEVLRGGLRLVVPVPKRAGEPLGVEVHSALFDQVQTCDNHCEFCFIYQLPPGLRPSLSVKDDDYRLSFLYGNFTTLTRFTELDLERVVTEGLSPLYVSIHATDPSVRSELLRNRRGATSLRWLRALLDHGITVHGQVVICPGINDGPVLEDTLAAVADRFSELATLAVVPVGVSRFSAESRLRAHTPAEACAVLEAIEEWQAIYLEVLRRRLVFAADEYYLLAQRPFPPAECYEGFPMHEDGIGMARAIELEFLGGDQVAPVAPTGFFAAIDAAPEVGYRAPRLPAGGEVPGPSRGRWGEAVGVLTAPLGAAVLRPLLARLGCEHVRVIEVENEFFGGNVAVTGLMVGQDLARVLRDEPEGERYLLPDVCLSNGRFLDGSTPSELPRQVEVVPTGGRALRSAIGLDEPAVHLLSGGRAQR